MSDDLLDTHDIAKLYRCTYRHARDVITKRPGFPDVAPGSTQRNPLWLRVEVRAYLHRKPVNPRINPESQGAVIGG